MNDNIERRLGAFHLAPPPPDLKARLLGRLEGKPLFSKIFVRFVETYFAAAAAVIVAALLLNTFSCSRLERNIAVAQTEIQELMELGCPRSSVELLSRLRLTVALDKPGRFARLGEFNQLSGGE